MIKTLKILTLATVISSTALSVTIEEGIETLHSVATQSHPALTEDDMRFQNQLENNPHGVLNEKLIQMVNPHTFGQVESMQPSGNAVYDEEQQRLMALANNRLGQLFPGSQTYTVHAVFETLSQYLSDIFCAEANTRNYEEAFAVLRKIRHLKDTQHFGEWKTPNGFGDIIAAPLMVRMLSIIRENHTGEMLLSVNGQRAELLSSIFYELSQSYSHLLNNYHKIVDESNDTLQIQKHHVTGSSGTRGFVMHSLGIKFNRAGVTTLRRGLLAFALKLNPENLQAKYRLLEMLADDGAQISPQMKSVFSRLANEHNAETRTAFALKNKKDKVNQHFNFIH